MVAFIAAIVGGFNQIRGALVGGLLIGVLDNLTATYVTASYRAALPLVLLIAIILWRPQGLLGTPEGARRVMRRLVKPLVLLAGLVGAGRRHRSGTAATSSICSVPGSFSP